MNANILYKDHWQRVLTNSWKATGASGAEYALARKENERGWILSANGVPLIDRFDSLEEAIEVIDDTENRMRLSRRSRVPW